jgi:hypothetical protein
LSPGRTIDTASSAETTRSRQPDAISALILPATPNTSHCPANPQLLKLAPTRRSGKTLNFKREFAVLAALRRGAQADLLDEVVWRQVYDFWPYAFFAVLPKTAPRGSSRCTCAPGMPSTDPVPWPAVHLDAAGSYPERSHPLLGVAPAAAARPATLAKASTRSSGPARQCRNTGSVNYAGERG